MKRLIIICVILVFTVSCEEKRCSGDLVCTEIFKIVSVQVKDENGAPLTLDSTMVLNVTNSTAGEARHMSYQNAYSYYVIADDSDRDNVSFDGSRLQFKGWMDAELVLYEEFLIGKDCCHIEKLEGPDEIIVD